MVQGLIAEFNSVHRGSVSQDDGDSNKSTPQQREISTFPVLSDTLHLLENAEAELFECLDLGVTKKISEPLDIPKGCSFRSTKRRGTLSEIASLIRGANASIAIVDRAIKSLSKDRNVCSSLLFREFLCLHTSEHFSSSSDRGGATKTILKGESIDHFVQNWLLQTHRPSATDKAILFLAVTYRHTLGGPLLSLLFTWSTLHCICTLWFMISNKPLVISIPLDTYVTLIALAFYFGHGTGMGSQSRHGKYARSGAPNTTHEENFLHRTSHVASPRNFGDGKLSIEDDHSTVAGEDSETEDEFFPELESLTKESRALSSPLPLFPSNGGVSCWSKPDHTLFRVRGTTYLENRVKVPSAPAPFQCRGVDVWITDNAERNIARHPSMLGGKLHQEDTFVVNFLLPFCNFVAYFSVPPLEQMQPNIANVWSKFIKGDQQYRDGKLKLLPIVVDGPWIVRKAVGPGTSPAMIGRDLPLQYYFSEPTVTKKLIFEVDVLISASRIARGILNVVKGHTKSLTIAFAFIIEACEEAELPETVLCAFQVHSLNLEDCPQLPDCYLEDQ